MIGELAVILLVIAYLFYLLNNEMLFLGLNIIATSLFIFYANLNKDLVFIIGQSIILLFLLTLMINKIKKDGRTNKNS